MGYYIEDADKLGWLNTHASTIIGSHAPAQHKRDDDYAVCLVNNGAFLAAGICVDQHERDAFSYPNDYRPKLWFYVPKDVLIAKCPRCEKVLS